MQCTLDSGGGGLCLTFIDISIFGSDTYLQLLLLHTLALYEVQMPFLTMLWTRPEP